MQGWVGMLQVLFIALKLTNVIKWEWWQVMLPLEITLGLVLLVLVVGVIGAVVKHVLVSKDPNFAIKQKIRELEEEACHERRR